MGGDELKESRALRLSSTRVSSSDLGVDLSKRNWVSGLKSSSSMVVDLSVLTDANVRD